LCFKDERVCGDLIPLTPLNIAWPVGAL
jgi:hypothetical protein